MTAIPLPFLKRLDVLNLIGFLFNFLFLLGKENEKNMATPGFEPTINQSIANSFNHWTTKLLQI